MSYRRSHNYDLRLLPNHVLAELEEGVTCEPEAVARSGLTVGYPAWNLLYYATLCSLRPESYNLIVEIGTNWGCSAVCLGQALRDSGYPGHVHTVDISEENLTHAREHIERSGLSDLIEIHCQDSLEFLRNIGGLDGQISFVFLDGCHHRDHVIGEFTLLFPHLDSRAIVFFDNTGIKTDRPRLREALQYILANFGGNLVDFGNVSWAPAGEAVWQKGPFWDGEPTELEAFSHQSGDHVTTLRFPPILHEEVMKALQGVEYPILLPEDYPVTTVVDIGSNIGATALYFSGLYPHSAIYCFEPSAKTMSLLKSNTSQIPGIRCFPFGLSNFEGPAELFEGVHHSAQNSLFRTAMTTGDATPVRVRDAATVLAELGVRQIGILKIDTEGCEVPILESILSSGLLLPAQIALEYHSEEDRIRIDSLLTPRYFLATSRSRKVHRGQVVYVLKSVFDGREDDFWYRIPPAAREPLKGLDHPTWMVTGADSAHFANSKMLVASWWRNERSMPLLFCDYGLSAEQRAEVLTWPVHLIDQPAEFRGLHPWRSKAGLVRYLRSVPRSWRNLIWIDADAILLRKLPPMEDLLSGYDLAIDAHSMSVAEIVKPECLEQLPLSATDAYYSSGFWITSSPDLLAEWDRLVEPVFLKGNLWENDAFVGAVYRSRVRIRPLCGNIWHARGATSLQTAEVRGRALFHQGVPVYVLHANWFFSLRADGRRVLDRPEFAAVQDYYEAEFEACLAEWKALGRMQ